MPQYTDNFNLVEPIGSDIFNPLTLQNPAITAIDAQMFINQNNSIPAVTVSKTGTLHAITRTIETAPMFRFISGADFRTGDTFTVNGQSVSAVLPTGEQLPDYAFRINSNVLCCLNGGQLTIYTAPIITNNSIVDLIHPVGSIIHMANTTDPNTIYTGTTWEKIEASFLFGSSDEYTIGTSGGETTVKLTVSNLANHTHEIQNNGLVYASQGSSTAPVGGIQSGSAFSGAGASAGIMQTNISATGGNTPHNNMPPYTVVNIWKRTA